MTGGPAVSVDPTAQIADSAAIGNPFRRLQDGRHVQSDRPTLIGPRVWIGHCVAIGAGVQVGADSIFEDFAEVQSGSEIGERVLVLGRAWIGLDTKIGNDCVIKGYIGDNSRIGNGCRVAGDLIHRQLDPSIPWDDPGAEEPAPNVGDGAFIGWRAVVIGGVNIGERAYVCSGALVTKDVPAGYIASGRNEFTHPSAWPGALGKTPFFQPG